MKRSALLFSLIIGLSFVLQAQEYGLASYYSDKFQDRPTASGELYDKNKLTAAHKTYPYGTYIRVTRLDNKKSVVVRVNDRGPYISGRVVDVSRKAAGQLGLITDGTARVKVEIVQKPANAEATASTPTPPPPAATSPARETTTSPATTTTPRTTTPVVTEQPREVVKADPPKEKEATTRTQTQPEPTPSSDSSNSSAGTSTSDEHAWVTLKNFQSYDLYKIELFKPEKAGFAVQVASLSSYENAMRQIADLQGKWLKNVLISIEKGPNGTAKYRILCGPFPERKQADNYRKSLKKRFKMDGFIVDLSTLIY